MPPPRKPSKSDLAAAMNKTISDVIAPDLNILFCGINPGLYSGYTGFHFARPGNRFWPTLHNAGFTPRRLAPAEEQELLQYGYGITNLVERATASAAELAPEELVAGGQRLIQKIEQYCPRVLAVLGVSAYRLAFGEPRAALGRQPERIGGALLWVLPNPSGLNAHYTPATLAEVYRAFRIEAEHERSR
ncbi:MAG: G/U mismatch-specific DNA glycosylase [Chloroflexales bacterium]|nr:G/U mismatch-specific DNA glycosylase [Chloroflexales bacterium]